MAEGEKFNLKKAVKSLNIADPVQWAKSLSVGIRLSIIAGLIFLAVFGWGYWRGHRHKPVQINLDDSKIVLVDKFGEQHELIIRNKQLTFDGQVVKVKDVKGLRPYGVHLHPKLAGGITSAGNPAAGLALELAYAYNFNLDLLAMVPFLGVGISYDIHLDKPLKIDNSSVGLGVGRDMEANENAVIIYYAIEF